MPKQKTQNLTFKEKLSELKGRVERMGGSRTDWHLLSEADLDVMLAPPVLNKAPLPPKGWQPRSTPKPEVKAPQPGTETAKRADFSFVLNLPPTPPAEMRAHDWKTAVFPRVEASKIPPKYRREILPHQWNCDPQKKVYGICRRKCSGVGAILALIGERGTGKTTLAGQLIVGEAWDGRVAPYRKLTGLVSEFKAIYADFGTIDEEDLSARRDRLCQRRLLIVDEIHEATADSRLALKVLTDILDKRYSNEVDTVLISNQTLEAFKASVNDSILSRITEHGLIIPCEWDSWREKLALQNL